MLTLLRNTKSEENFEFESLLPEIRVRIFRDDTVLENIREKFFDSNLSILRTRF